MENINENGFVEELKNDDFGRKIEEAVGPYDFFYCSLDDIVANLKKCKEKGENIYTYFCANKLYSLFDDEDSCYKKVTGMTKSEYDKMKKEQYPDKYTPLEIENIKRKSTHFDTDFNTLEEAILYLDKYKKAEKNINIYFNYVKLYSLLDDRDSCYEKVLGISSKEISEKVEGFEERYAEIEAKRKENADNNYQEWVDRGIKLIYPQKMADWENCVLECMGSIYHGKEIETALKVMETLENDEDDNVNFPIAKRHLLLEDKNVTDSSYDKVVDIVLNYSKKGVKFVKYLEPLKANKKPLKNVIKRIEEQNLKFVEESQIGNCDCCNTPTVFDKILDEDEKVIKIIKPNKLKFFISNILTMSFSLFVFAFVGVMAVLCPDEGMVIDKIYVLIPIGIFVLLEILIVVLISIYYKNYYFAYTNKRIIIRSGVIGVDFRSLDMGMIGAIDVYTSVIDKIIGKDTGTVRFGSTASPMSSSTYRFAHIKNPYESCKEFKKAIDEYKKSTNQLVKE